MRPGSDSIARYRAAFAERNLVQEIEALAARAWPPLTLLDLDGWQLRSSGGLSRRANSVWPRAEGGRLPMDDRLRQAEAFYVQAGMDPVVQLSPSARPQGLEALLRRRGYAVTPDLVVRTRRADLLPDLAPGRAGTGSDPEVELHGTGTWLEGWAAATGAGQRALTIATRMLERVPLPSAYAVLRRRSGVAVARGVVDGGWLGIDLLGASPALRAADVGRALLAALGRWGVANGAVSAWLEVDEGDPAVRALTADTGFRRGYVYRFRVLPRALAAR